MQNLRSPQLVDAYVKAYGRVPSAELDRLCGQFAAHTTLLYWFTDLGAALAEARRTRRPVLSLRLLGRLDEEQSCANSRLFRRMLYPEPRINRLLRGRFVMHWQSLRPVPKLTIDYGDGRRAITTIAGNSVHVILDGNGRPIDALPGMFSPDAFLAALTGERDVDAPREPSRAVIASRIAATKHVIESPLLRALSQDTIDNGALRVRILDMLARYSWTADQLVAWIYRELFAMPLDDDTLGLVISE